MLTGWALNFHKRSVVDGSGKCNLVQTRDATVAYAAVYEIDEAELTVLDRIEGRGIGYEHHFLDVPRFGRAVTYLAKDLHIDDSLIPYHWYKELVIVGCEFHGVDGDYLAGLEALSHCDDPDQERQSENMALVRELRAAR